MPVSPLLNAGNIPIVCASESGTEGKFSLEFCVSAGIIDGKVGVGQFTDERVTSVDISRMIEKFEWRDFEGEVTSPFASKITVTLTDGSTISRDVVRPMGEPGNPMSKDQIFEKYTECVGNNSGFEAARHSLELLGRL